VSSSLAAVVPRTNIRSPRLRSGKIVFRDSKEFFTLSDMNRLMLRSNYLLYSTTAKMKTAAIARLMHQNGAGNSVASIRVFTTAESLQLCPSISRRRSRPDRRLRVFCRLSTKPGSLYPEVLHASPSPFEVVGQQSCRRPIDYLRLTSAELV